MEHYIFILESLGRHLQPSIHRRYICPSGIIAVPHSSIRRIEMRRVFSILLFWLLFILSIYTSAQDTSKPLTNTDVISLVKAGLADNVILLSIERSKTSCRRA